MNSWALLQNWDLNHSSQAGKRDVFSLQRFKVSAESWQCVNDLDTDCTFPSRERERPVAYVLHCVCMTTLPPNPWLFPLFPSPFTNVLISRVLALLALLLRGGPCTIFDGQAGCFSFCSSLTEVSLMRVSDTACFLCLQRLGITKPLPVPWFLSIVVSECGCVFPKERWVGTLVYLFVCLSVSQPPEYCPRAQHGFTFRRGLGPQPWTSQRHGWWRWFAG